MRKLYTKLSDINLDIKEYKDLQRKYPSRSIEYKEIAKELKWLVEYKKKLNKTNKGNAAYWHYGIPPAEMKKTKPLTEQSRRQKDLQFLKKEIEFYSNKDQSKEIKEHLEDLKSRRAMI